MAGKSNPPKDLVRKSKSVRNIIAEAIQCAKKEMIGAIPPTIWNEAFIGSPEAWRVIIEDEVVDGFTFDFDGL